jgi:hypothetical protein
LKQTRRLVISDRVFTSKDLLRIANIVAKQQTAEHEQGKKKFEVKFDDDTTVESESPEVIQDEWLVEHGRRPIRIEMSYYNFTLDRHIGINLSHGDDSYGNEVRVSGSGADWVQANFFALKEAVEAVRSQNVWIRRHSNLLVNFIALGIGCLCFLIIELLAIAARKLGVPGLKEFWAEWKEVRASGAWPFLYFYGWVWRYLTGLFLGAFAVRTWLLSIWPSIEFDFGPEHLRREKIKRDRLYSVGALVILPILITLLCDLIVRAF